MTLRTIINRSGRGLVAAAAIAGVLGVTAVPQPAHAVSPGAAVGIGLGAFALGSAVGAGAAYPYGYYGYAPSYYYPPAPAYYPQGGGSCWSSYYGRYVPC